jgi:hypothetical protein
MRTFADEEMGQLLPAAKAYSAKAYSAKGYSAKGYSAKGYSAKGYVAKAYSVESALAALILRTGRGLPGNRALSADSKP